MPSRLGYCSEWPSLFSFSSQLCSGRIPTMAFRYHSWQSVGGPYAVPGNEPGWAACKASALTISFQNDQLAYTIFSVKKTSKLQIILISRGINPNLQLWPPNLLLYPETPLENKTRTKDPRTHFVVTGIGALYAKSSWFARNWSNEVCRTWRQPLIILPLWWLKLCATPPQYSFAISLSNDKYLQSTFKLSCIIV